MYLEFYGLREAPFGLTPNPNYIFKTESYLEAISNLKYGIYDYKGIVLMTGEVGTGKTTTLRSMMQQLGHDILTAYILNPYLEVPEFFQTLAAGLHLGLATTATKPEILESLTRCVADRHVKGLRTVLVVDEAHGLSNSVLEQIRLLANLETNTDKLLQIVLCGQPELRDTLNQPALRQLKQRISLRCSLRPLAAYEVHKYVRFRLKTAGAERVDIFDREATDLIAGVSLGIPRVINNICDNALLRGFARGLRVLNESAIEEVVDLLDLNVVHAEFAGSNPPGPGAESSRSFQVAHD
jgi:general secretion pathway protein A